VLSFVVRSILILILIRHRHGCSDAPGMLPAALTTSQRRRRPKHRLQPRQRRRARRAARAFAWYRIRLNLGILPTWRTTDRATRRIGRSLRKSLRCLGIATSEAKQWTRHPGCRTARQCWVLRPRDRPERGSELGWDRTGVSFSTLELMRRPTIESSKSSRCDLRFLRRRNQTRAAIRSRPPTPPTTPPTMAPTSDISPSVSMRGQEPLTGGAAFAGAADSDLASHSDSRG